MFLSNHTLRGRITQLSGELIDVVTILSAPVVIVGVVGLGHLGVGQGGALSGGRGGKLSGAWSGDLSSGRGLSGRSRAVGMTLVARAV